MSQDGIEECVNYVCDVHVIVNASMYIDHGSIDVHVEWLPQDFVCEVEDCYNYASYRIKTYWV